MAELGIFGVAVCSPNELVKMIKIGPACRALLDTRWCLVCERTGAPSGREALAQLPVSTVLIVCVLVNLRSTALSFFAQIVNDAEHLLAAAMAVDHLAGHAH